MFKDPEISEALMQALSDESGGEIINEPWEVFQNATEYFHKVIDPKIAFIIIALVLFLLDIAVRKFKWKWPHEIIRERKAKLADFTK